MADIFQFPQTPTNNESIESNNEADAYAHSVQLNYEHLLDATTTDEELFNMALSFSYQSFDQELSDSYHRMVAQAVVELYKPIAA
jgi:P2-related tail formation protein